MARSLPNSLCINAVALGDTERVLSERLLNGRYRLTDVLGSGGMSVVWQARDEVLNRTVAIKVLAAPQAADPQVRRRMLAEAQAAATLTHPHLVNVFDYGESPGPNGEPVPFVVMEVVTGPTLANRAAADSLSPAEAVEICAQIANALAALHQHGMVHRDIKPSNVMLTRDGAKVIDFGIAALLGAPEAGDGGEILGTPSYLAPERLLGGDVSPATDVYALGVLTYWLLAHQRPWPAGSAADTIRAHIDVEPEPLPAIDGVPTQVADIVRRCLAKDPELRPAAADVASALASAARDAAVEESLATWRAGRQTVALGEARTARRRRRAILAGAAGLAAVLTVIAVLPSLAGPTAPSAAVAGPTVTPDRLPSPPRATASQPATSPGPSPIVTTKLVPVPGRPGAFRTEIVTVPVTLPPSTIISTATSLVPPPPPPSGQILTAIGGTVRVLCQGTIVTVISAQPASGFAITVPSGAPATQVRIVFRSATHESEIKARCGPQGLIPTIIETPLPPP